MLPLGGVGAHSGTVQPRDCSRLLRRSVQPERNECDERDERDCRWHAGTSTYARKQQERHECHQCHRRAECAAGRRKRKWRRVAGGSGFDSDHHWSRYHRRSGSPRHRRRHDPNDQHRTTSPRHRASARVPARWGEGTRAGAGARECKASREGGRPVGAHRPIIGGGRRRARSAARAASDVGEAAKQPETSERTSRRRSPAGLGVEPHAQLRNSKSDPERTAPSKRDGTKASRHGVPPLSDRRGAATRRTPLPRARRRARMCDSSISYILRVFTIL